MTKVYAERSGHRCILSAQGHATGSEQVCAAVSGLLYALAGYLASAVRESYIEFYKNEIEDGSMLLDFNGDEATTAAFTMAVIGLRQIAQSYPDFLQVEYLEE